MAMFRITSFKVVPYAVRAISSLSGSMTNAINGCDKNTGISHHHNSTDAKKQIEDRLVKIIKSEIKLQQTFVQRDCCDKNTGISHHHNSTDAKKQIEDKLVKIIKSEIKLQQTFVQRDDMPPNPNESPFTFEDNPWDEHVTLSRDYDGEKIDIVVTMPYGSGILEDYVEEDEIDEEEEPWRLYLKLKVTISKTNGKILEFNITAFVDGRMEISSYSLVKEAESETSQRRIGPHSMSRYKKEKSNLKNALVEFLKVRGIKTSNYAFLFDYMLKKWQRSPVGTLKELKRFLQTS